MNHLATEAPNVLLYLIGYYRNYINTTISILEYQVCYILKVLQIKKQHQNITEIYRDI